jgi:hypothetical protein
MMRGTITARLAGGREEQEREIVTIYLLAAVAVLAGLKAKDVLQVQTEPAGGEVLLRWRNLRVLCRRGGGRMLAGQAYPLVVVSEEQRRLGGLLLRRRRRRPGKLECLVRWTFWQTRHKLPLRCLHTQDPSIRNTTHRTLVQRR